MLAAAAMAAASAATDPLCYTVDQTGQLIQQLVQDPAFVVATETVANVQEEVAQVVNTSINTAPQAGVAVTQPVAAPVTQVVTAEVHASDVVMQSEPIRRLREESDESDGEDSGEEQGTVGGASAESEGER